MPCSTDEFSGFIGITLCKALRLWALSTELMAQNKLDSYVSSTDSGPDVLGYWHGKEDIWPKLSMCARWILSIPATSTSSERVFFMAGRTLEWMTADHNSIQKLLTICYSCMACLNSANNTVDVGRQQCRCDSDFIDFVCTVPFQSVFFCDFIQCSSQH